MRHRSPSAPRALALLACALVAAPLGACGSSRSAAGPGVDPALAVPASAPAYLGAVVRPSGALLAKARAAAKTLTHEEDPYVRLLGALQTPGSPALDFKRDIAPWLGAQAGIFLGSGAPAARAAIEPLLSSLPRALLRGSGPVAFPFAAAGSDGAIVLDATNAGAARSFLSAQAARAGAHAASFRGVAYQATPGGVAFGLVDRFAVVGTETALRGVIDTSKGGPSLAHSASYAHLLAAAPAEALAHVYLGAGPAAPAGRGGASPDLLALLTGGRPANVSLLPSRSAIALDADTLPAAAPGAAAGLLWPQAEGARAAGEVPGESFLAIGFGSARTALAGYAQALTSLASGGTPARPGGEAAGAGISIKGLLTATLAPVRALTEEGAEARRNFASWMGAGAVFASGSGLLELKAAVVCIPVSIASWTVRER